MAKKTKNNASKVPINEDNAVNYIGEKKRVNEKKGKEKCIRDVVTTIHTNR